MRETKTLETTNKNMMQLGHGDVPAVKTLHINDYVTKYRVSFHSRFSSGLQLLLVAVQPVGWSNSSCATAISSGFA